MMSTRQLSPSFAQHIWYGRIDNVPDGLKTPRELDVLGLLPFAVKVGSRVIQKLTFMKTTTELTDLYFATGQFNSRVKACGFSKYLKFLAVVFEMLL